MSSTGGTPGPGYVAGEKDTEAVTGNPGPAATGTAFEASNKDTEGATGGSRATEPHSPAVTPFDTTAANGGASGPVSPTGLRSTLDTTQFSVGGTPVANPAYRAPSQTAPGSTFDSTRTDVQPGGSETNPVPASYDYPGTLSSYDIGAAGSGTGANPPAAPTNVTAASGPRQVTVSWTGVADVANDPTRGYVVLDSAGGTTFAAANATSATVTRLDPSHEYTFQVAARNRAGLGAYSAASAPVRSYNPDEADPLKPSGLTAANRVNPIYRPDGTFLGGTGGTNNAPALGAITPGAAGSKTVTVAFTAPTIGQAPTSYVVTASDGTKATAAGNATSADVVFAASGASVSFTVQAINTKGSGEVSPASAVVTVP